MVYFNISVYHSELLVVRHSGWWGWGNGIESHYFFKVAQSPEWFIFVRPVFIIRGRVCHAADDDGSNWYAGVVKARFWRVLLFRRVLLLLRLLMNKANCFEWQKTSNNGAAGSSSTRLDKIVCRGLFFGETELFAINSINSVRFGTLLKLNPNVGSSGRDQWTVTFRTRIMSSPTYQMVDLMPY